MADSNNLPCLISPAIPKKAESRVLMADSNNISSNFTYNPKTPKAESRRPTAFE